MWFVYVGPPGERVESNFHALTGEWITGEPREIGDEAAIAWLRRHPHWLEVIDGTAEEVPAPVLEAPRRGRPRKVA